MHPHADEREEDIASLNITFEFLTEKQNLTVAFS